MTCAWLYRQTGAEAPSQLASATSSAHVAGDRDTSVRGHAPKATTTNSLIGQPQWQVAVGRSGLTCSSTTCRRSFCAAMVVRRGQNCLLIGPSAQLLERLVTQLHRTAQLLKSSTGSTLNLTLHGQRTPIFYTLVPCRSTAPVLSYTARVLQAGSSWLQHTPVCVPDAQATTVTSIGKVYKRYYSRPHPLSSPRPRLLTLQWLYAFKPALSVNTAADPPTLLLAPPTLQCPCSTKSACTCSTGSCKACGSSCNSCNH